jgi:ATP-binding cassette subfamily B protein
VALVQQDVFLFDASIHDNVAYAEPEAERDEVIEAASIAQIHNRVIQLPEGYRTQVGERGVALSGGQRQRLSIARGLAANPSIIIFDDSTAAIDGETERRVRAELKRSIGHKTTIIIAHRLSSLSSADEILMLASGRIVERGTHAQLVAANGAYAALWRLQAETATTAPLAADLERIFETQT